MTRREKFEMAFSKDGTREFPVIIPYEDIFIRDHWEEIFEYPWWYRFEFDVEKQFLWRSYIIDKLGQDWFSMPKYTPDEERVRFFIDVKENGVFCVDRVTGEKKKLEKPTISGWNMLKDKNLNLENIINTEAEIDIKIKNFSTDIKLEHKDSLVEKLKEKYGNEFMSYYSVTSPLSCCYNRLWDFYNLMIMIGDNPKIVKYACKKFLEQTLLKIDEAKFMGVDIIWIEEFFTDMISPDDFKRINLPFIKELIDYIKEKGMKSIYYYCGNPGKKLNLILSCGMDAVAFEESKKGFTIDIERIAEILSGKITLLGNLDSIFLEKCNYQDLKDVINFQVNIGRKNKCRFIISTGSPITPNTSFEKVRLYIQLGHEIGKI